MNTLRLPSGYTENLNPIYHVDAPYASSDVVHQPDVYAVANYLIAATERTTIIDIGCGNGRKLRGIRALRHVGVDFGENITWCRTQHVDWGEWVAADLAAPESRTLAALADDTVVIVCADVVEHLINPLPLIDLLAECHARGAILITSTPDRIRVRGRDHKGPPPNPAHVREWALDEYVGLLADRGLPAIFSGYTINNNINRELKTIITIHDSRVVAVPTGPAPNPVAIVAAFNEADIIETVVGDLVDQGCDVVLVDNWSTDGTFDIEMRLAQQFGPRVTVERFPASGPADHYEWQAILRRKEEIASAYPNRWILHADADELRRSPFPGLTLRDSFNLVRSYGCNRVNFTVLNFRPVDFESVTCAVKELRHFDYGTRPGHFVQWKAWLQGSERVDLAGSGGHAALFANVRDFPYKFLVQHYPIRSHAHGLRKVFEERQTRWSSHERQQGWHTQYDHFDRTSEFVWKKSGLFSWEDDMLFWREHGLNVITGLPRHP